MGGVSVLSQFLTILWKELTETARDRRTILTAFLLGPIAGPLLFTVMMSLSIERGQTEVREPAHIAVIGAGNAPELVAYLRSVGALLEEITPAAGSGEADAQTLAQDAIGAKRARAALVIGPWFGTRLRQGSPAPLAIYADSSDRHAEAVEKRLLHWLNAYGSGLGAMRLQARGLDPQLVSALAIDEVDVATPASRALLMLGMLSYFILLATLVGGLHVAIDMTAGERERGSLEPLLAQPVGRATLLLAKVAAAGVYMLAALATSLIALSLLLPHLGLESLGMRANFGPWVVLRIFLVMAPFVPFGAALLTLVASFTKSYREAQTWLSFVLLVPTLPIAFASLYQIEAKAQYMLIPSLGQHLIITSLLRDEGLSPTFWLLSLLSSTLLAALLLWLALRLWRRESLLG